MEVIIYSIFAGVVLWVIVCYILAGFYTVDQNERAVKTVFGRAERVGDATTLKDPIAEHLKEEEKERYTYPQVRVIPPGGPYFKWPWEKIYKVSIATQTVNMAYDPEDSAANNHGTMLDAVTKDQLDTGLKGQIRYRVSEKNLYAYLFGVKQPITHIMGYFISVLREKIANFEAPTKEQSSKKTSVRKGKVKESQETKEKKGAKNKEKDKDKEITQEAEKESQETKEKEPNLSLDAESVSGVSINDLRKNLRDLNEHMERECVSSQARYGIVLDASLITSIDPPGDVESALAAINTAHNEVSSDISLAQASADQKIVQSRRAVEIETLKAQAEVEPLRAMAEQLADLKKNGGSEALQAYLRNVRLALYSRARHAIVEVKK